MELGFVAIFSAVVLGVFFSVMSMNGLVLGNDPAVHLEKVRSILQSGEISATDVGWTPPLFHILLATFMSFIGGIGLNQMILLVKIVAAVVTWLLFFSIYLLGSKVFGRKVAVAAAIILLFVFPMYEMVMWGGYTTILALAFMSLLFLYLPLATRGAEYLVLAFLFGFSLVLSHQLATFLAVLILAPVMLYMLVKSRGKYIKVLIALTLGGGIVFSIYYLPPIAQHLDVLVEHVFLAQKAYSYQIPATSFNAFMVNFGFILFLALAGIFCAYVWLRAGNNFSLYLLLLLGFLVPLLLSQSHYFGLYLPFHWFIYYMLPSIAILAAISLSFTFNRICAAYSSRRGSKLLPRILTFSAVILLCSLFVVQFGAVYGKIMEGSVFYSTSDVKAYDAGLWLNQNFPGPATVVVTKTPGSWFALFSGKLVIAQTDPNIDRILAAESVLHLSYEMENPLTLVRAYDSKGGISGENYVSIDGVWKRIAYSSDDGDFLSFQLNGISHNLVPLSSFLRVTTSLDQNSTKTIIHSYTNDEVTLTKTLQVQNSDYSTTVSWAISSPKGEITDVALYVSTFFDLQFTVDNAYLQGSLDWANPWNISSAIRGPDWAVVEFSRENFVDNFVGFYDDKNQVFAGLELIELPDWGNIGALANGQINALRFQYEFGKIDENQTVSFTYKFLSFSRDSYPGLQEPDELETLFHMEPTSVLNIIYRDYYYYIKNFGVEFVVYDRNQLDTKLVRSRFLELVYSNDRYAIFKIKT